MSAEGKKKRGESGSSNAKTSPYRLSGGGCWPLHLRQVMATLKLENRIGRNNTGSANDKPIPAAVFPKRSP